MGAQHPEPVRYVVAYDTKLAKRELGLSSVKKAHPAAVVVVQRFASAAQLNWHLHAFVADGVFTEDRDGTARFRALPAPEKGDLLAVAWSTCQRAIALLRKLGRWVDAEAGELPDTDREKNSLLAQVHAAAIAGVLLFDNQRRPMRLFGAPARELTARPRLCRHRACTASAILVRSRRMHGCARRLCQNGSTIATPRARTVSATSLTTMRRHHDADSDGPS